VIPGNLLIEPTRAGFKERPGWSPWDFHKRETESTDIIETLKIVPVLN
jgi:hypothetical protein